MYDLVVIGGGFWGTAIAVEARSNGMNTLVLDNADTKGASRNAAGIICLGWYKQQTVKSMLPSDWTHEEILEGFEWLKSRCKVEHTGELFTNFQQPKAKPKYREDCYLVPGCHSLLNLTSRTQRTVDSLVAHNGVWSISTGAGVIQAKKVAIAAGAFTDQLLEKSNLTVVNVRPLLGRAIIANLSKECETPHTIMTRPYTHYTLRPWGNSMVGRLGDTVERSQKNREAANRGILAALAKLAPGAKPLKWLEGLRPVCDTMCVKQVAKGLVVATGGHRVGLALSGLVAKRAVALLSA